MTRGEVWNAATGYGLGEKPRPVVVIQAQPFLQGPIILIAPLSTSGDDHRPIRPRIEPDEMNLLIDPSDAMVDLVMPVRAERFGKRIGRLSGLDIARIDRQLLVYLGLADSTR